MRKTLEYQISQKRKQLEKEIDKRDDDRCLYLGNRFYSDDVVKQRIIKAKERSLEKFYGKDVIRAALLDCASADYYYMFEKDWGYEERETDDGE